MELKERSSLKTVWGMDPAKLELEDALDNIESIEFDEAEFLPDSLRTTLSPVMLSEADFLSNEVYIELHQRHQARLEATLEALKAQARRSQPAVAPRPMPASPPPAAKQQAHKCRPSSNEGRGCFPASIAETKSNTWFEKLWS